jgi:hypothetical protein
MERFRPRRSATGPLTRDPNQAAATRPESVYPHSHRVKSGNLTQQERRHKPALKAAIEIDPRKLGPKRFHRQNAGDDSLVITKEEPSKGGKLCVSNSVSRSESMGFHIWTATETYTGQTEDIWILTDETCDSLLRRLVERLAHGDLICTHGIFA